jgi:hypothetical protein
MENMLELYPTKVLSPLQIEHILRHWRKKAFLKTTKRDHRAWLHIMKASFFQHCIPRLLHDVVFDQSAAHTESARRFVYAIREVPAHAHTKTSMTTTSTSTGANAPHRNRTWHPCPGPRYIVPLTGDLGVRFRDHPEVHGISRGRLVIIKECEMYRDMENLDKMPRLLLCISLY